MVVTACLRQTSPATHCWFVGANICAMPRRGTRDEWLHDIEARQRNVVFPDTAANEGRFWRNIIRGNRRLTTVQKIGIGVLALMAISLAFVITFVEGNLLSDFSWDRLAGTVIRWMIAFAILGAFLLLFRLSQRPNQK